MKSRKNKLFLLLTMLSTLNASIAFSQVFTNYGNVGAYLLEQRVGRYKTLTSMQQFLEKKGVNSIRMLLSPSNDMNNFYGINATKYTKLNSLVLDSQIVDLIKNSAFETICFTTYDYTTYDGNFLNSNFNSINKAKIIQEYKDLFKGIDSLNITHKRIIIANWEGDNSVYCGQSYAYSQFYAKYHTAPNGKQPGDTILKCPAPKADNNYWGIARWLNIRQQALVEYRSTLSPYSPSKIEHAVEFNSLTYLQAVGLPGLFDLLTAPDSTNHISADYVSYSCYESLNKGTLKSDIKKIRDDLNIFHPEMKIMIGEFGSSTEQKLNFTNKERFIATYDSLKSYIQTLQDCNNKVDISFIWEGFEDAVRAYDIGWPLYNDDGTARLSPEVDGLFAPRISEITYDNATIVIWGTFPTHNTLVYAYNTDNNNSIQLPINYIGKNQINITAVPPNTITPTNISNWSFRVVSAEGISSSWKKKMQK